MTMNAEKPDGDSDSDDTITSNACSGSSGEESDHGEISDSESISLSVVSTTSTVTSKKPPNPNKKRVSFKPGDSLVLIYEIPNRAMLGLKSDSESSYDEDGEESDDEDDDDDSDTEDDDSSDEDDKDCNNSKNKGQKRNAKALPKLLSVKSISRRNNVECNTDIKRDSRKVAKLIGLSLNHTQQPPTQRRRFRCRMRGESGDNDSMSKKEPHPKAILVDEVKRKRSNTRMSTGLNAIPNHAAHNRSGRRRRNRHFLEIKATLPPRKEANSNNLGVTKYKHDLKPSIATLDSHGAISVCGKQSSQTLTQRSRLQPVSFRLAKTRLTHGSVDRSVYSSVTSLEKDTNKHVPDVKQTMSATYETLQSLKRLDPDNMNSKTKRNYAWQVANGNISSHHLVYCHFGIVYKIQ